MGKKAFLILITILIAKNIFAFGNKESNTENENAYITALADTPPANASRAEQVMKALAQAYPQQIEKVEFRNGDWAVLLRGTWYYYADSKLLPEKELTNAASYNAHGFYNYRAELPAWETPSAQEQERLRNMSNSRRQTQIRRNPAFFDDLWRMHNRSESYDRVKSMRFLGKPVTVHFMIMEELALVEEEIFALAKKEPQVQTWVNGISEITGWGWRNIAETQTRSYHAYGLAIDIIPKSYGGKETYWLWAQRNRADWWNIPYSSRYHPPAGVIKAFEKYGFIWGGKWLFFDTMHFEYRPEILILSGMNPETRR